MDSKCRVCSKAVEHISHLTIYWSIFNEIELYLADKYYDHIPEKNHKKLNNIDVMWDMAVITKKKIICILVEVSIPDNGNIVNKEDEKISKCKVLEIEMNRMWNPKPKCYPLLPKH